MNRKFKKMFLPAIAAGLLVFGANGLKESAIYRAKADYTGFYVSRNPGLRDSALKNRVRMSSDNNLDPSFTFIIPGLGGDASNWSNDVYYDSHSHTLQGNGNFALDFDSLPYNMQHYMLNDTLLYVGTYGKSNLNDYSFTLKKKIETVTTDGVIYEDDPDFKTLGAEFSHHIFIYEDYDEADSMQSFEKEYRHFEHFANTLASDFFALHGFRPKINLIGHSRGGLVAQRYLNDYPYNVSGIYTLATPFTGTQLGDLVDIVRIFVPDLNLGRLQGTFDSQGYKDIQNSSIRNTLRNNWNTVYATHRTTQTHAYGSVITLPFLMDIIGQALNSGMVPAELQGTAMTVIEALLSMIDQINDVLSYNPNSIYDLNDLFEYNSFQRICGASLNTTRRNQIKAIIRSTLDYIVPDDIDNVAGIIWTVVTILCPPLGLLAKGITEAVINEVCNMILDHIASIDGKVGIFLDDGMVNIGSQMAYGFDGYVGFVKVIDQDYFNEDDMHPTRNDLLIGHNLETINYGIVNDIKKLAKCTNFNQIFNTEVCTDVVIDNPNITSSNFSYTIFPATERIEFDGNKLKEKWDTDDIPYLIPSLDINYRTTPLHIYLTDIRTNGVVSNNSFIKYGYSNTFDLYIHYSGTNYLDATYSSTSTPKPAISVNNANLYFVGASDASLVIVALNGASGQDKTDKPKASGYVDTYNGKDGANGDNGTDGKNGSSGIKCNALHLEEAKHLVVYGGRGGNGGNGARGGDGADGKRHDNGFKGGNGGNAGNGGNGGKGGNGGYAIDCSSVYLTSDSFTLGNINLHGGRPGDGGNGGAGGNGGNGANGTYFWVIFRSAQACNHDGGDAGDGGLVGYGGNSGVSKFSSTTTTYGGSFSAYYTSNNSYANGGNCGAKFGNSGDAGQGSSGAGAHGYSGSCGNAVTGWRSLHGMIPGKDSVLTYHYPTQTTYCFLNGMGRNSAGEERPNTFMPQFGTLGSD